MVQKVYREKIFLPMLGHPLISWSIKQGQKSTLITRTIVSTDDNEIADVANNYGAEIPFMRPKELAQDQSPDIDTFQHALNWLDTHENYRPDLVVHLRPTGPARKVSIIDNAIQLIADTPSADSLRSVSLASQTPYKMWFINNDKTLRPVITLEGVKESHSIARQMLPKAYWQNGYVDIIKPETILAGNSMVGNKALSYIIDQPVCDVDYLDDIPIVESALKQILESPDTNKHAENEITERFPV